MMQVIDGDNDICNQMLLFFNDIIVSKHKWIHIPLNEPISSHDHHELKLK